MNIPYKLNNLNIPRNHQRYFELLTSNLFRFHITKPTRLGRRGTKDSTIDHIWSNLFYDSYSFIINNKISDHLPNAVIFDCNVNPVTLKNKFFNLSVENTKKFVKNKCVIFEKLLYHTISDVNVSTKYIFEEVMKICRVNFPIKCQQVSKKRIETPWLTKTMIKCIRKKHKLYSMYKNGDIVYSTYRDFAVLLRKTINLSRNNYEKNAFNEISGNTKAIWKRINTLMRPSQNTDPPFIVDTNKISYSDNDKIGTAFNQFYINLSKAELAKLSNKTVKNCSALIEINKKSMVMYPTTPNEIIPIIKNLKNRNTIDDIPTKVIKIAHKEMSIILCNLFNKMIETGVYPSLLLSANVSPIYKSGSRTDIKNYRPISILKIFDKIFEKLIHARLENFFNRYNLFSKNQFGFSKGKDTSIAVINLVHDVIQNQKNNSFSLCVFADLSKAFDTVNHGILLHKLHRYGVRGKSYDLLESFLTNRKQRVKFKDTYSDELKVESGVPQGSCLGPLLYNIYTNDLEKTLTDCSLTMYADDLTLVISGNDINQLAEKVNSQLKLLEEYCIHNKLSPNALKTFYILFSNHNLANTILPDIKLCNSSIKKVEALSYLGINLDDKLKFENHALILSNKLNMHKSIARKINNKLSLIASKIYCFSIIQSKI